MAETVLWIGGLCFRLIYQNEIVKDREIAPFEIDSKFADFKIRFLEDIEVSDTKVDAAADFSEMTVRYQPSLAGRFGSLRGCLMHIPMEQMLLSRNRFFLHSSFVTSPWGGLLFTGNSGIGKSTQAELWRIYMKSVVINGDRAIIAKEETGWRAYGSPYVGSSGYYVRRDEPIKAVILLKQAKENEVTRAALSEAFQKLFLQVSLDHSDADQVKRLCDLLSELITSVPVYRQCCTPDERAVEALKNVIDLDLTVG